MQIILEQVIAFVTSAFSGKKERFGPFPLPPALHSLRVGHDLISYGFPLDTCLGGCCHDMLEDCGVSLEEIARRFGQQVADYVSLCSLHPRFNGEHNDQSEDDLYSRVISWVEEHGENTAPVAIKCADSMDTMRFLTYCPREWRVPLLLRAIRWLETGRRFGLPAPMMDDFKTLIRRAESNQ